MGELAVRADALGDARQLATTHPEVVIDLLPAIVRTVTDVAAAFQSKGRGVLPGEYDTKILRRGLAVITDMAQEHRVAGDAEVIDSASTAVLRVLSDDTIEQSARQDALVALGELAAMAPDCVAEHLADNSAVETSPASGVVIDRVIAGTDDTDRLSELLAAVAFLASDDRHAHVIDTVSRSTLQRCAVTDDDRVRIWCHVINRASDRSSMVDPIQTWESFLEGQAGSETAFALWVLIQHTATEPVHPNADSPVEPVLRQMNSVESFEEAARLPDSLFDPAKLEADIADVAANAELSVRLRAARLLLKLIDTADGTTDHLSEACTVITEALERASELSSEDIEVALTDLARCTPPTGQHTTVLNVFEVALGHPDLGLRIHAAEILPTLSIEGGLPVGHRTRALDVLAAALEADNLLHRLGAVGTLSEYVVEETFTAADRDRMLALLEDTLDHDDEHVRTWAAHAFADLVVDEGMPQAHRERVIDALQTVLQDDASPVRTWAAVALADLTTTKTVPEWSRSMAVNTLRDALDDDDPDLRIEAAGALVDLAVDSGRLESLGETACRTLTAALEDPDSEIRRWAARRLTTLAVQDDLPSHHYAKTLDILLTAIELDGLQDQEDADRLEQLCTSIPDAAAILSRFSSRVATLLDPDRPVVSQSLLAGLSTLPRSPTAEDLETKLQRLLIGETPTGLQIRALEVRSQLAGT
ncbi:HEAT repeat domain-containing protein [Halorientalis marina]|uniref:HEAT repeat domain-containing protein n=1 Tax=Halorientalis marina TaxID=2931976 RepID=UPI001FF1184E|nr:HEAT repeat domain-containing protein [Halorientalis marina]